MKRFVVAPLLLTALLMAACAPMIPSATTPAATEPVPVATTEATAAETATEEAAATPAEPQDIVDTAIGAGNFTTLVAGLQAADLVDALKGEGPFTVFAPTDDAFAAIPASTLKALLADPKGQFAKILLYHVVPGKIMAADLSDGLEADTLHGSKVKFSIVDDTVKINDATIVTTDIVATNGVIHVIDAVLLPPAE